MVKEPWIIHNGRSAYAYAHGTNHPPHPGCNRPLSSPPQYFAPLQHCTSNSRRTRAPLTPAVSSSVTPVTASISSNICATWDVGPQLCWSSGSSGSQRCERHGRPQMGPFKCGDPLARGPRQRGSRKSWPQVTGSHPRLCTRSQAPVPLSVASHDSRGDSGDTPTGLHEGTATIPLRRGKCALRRDIRPTSSG